MAKIKRLGNGMVDVDGLIIDAPPSMNDAEILQHAAKVKKHNAGKMKAESKVETKTTFQGSGLSGAK